MRTSVVSSATIARCPIRSIGAGHYRDDGSCLCDDYRKWPDDELAVLIGKRVDDVNDRRARLAAALIKVARDAEADAASAGVVPPEALALSYLTSDADARRERTWLLEARDRLAAAATERNRREGTIP